MVGGTEYLHSVLSTPVNETTPSRGVYTLNGKYQLLVGAVGIEDSATTASSQVFWVLGDGKELWKSSPVSPQSKKGEDFRIDVSGVQKLELLTRSLGNHWGANNIWMDIRLVKLPKEKQPAPDEQAVADDDCETIYLTDLKPVSVNAHAFTQNKPHSVNGTQYLHGMQAHPLHWDTPAHIVFDLESKYDLLVGGVGIVDGSAPASPQCFYVVGDGKELWRSDSFKPPKTQQFRIDVSGVRKLELFADPIYDSHFGAHDFWMDPQLLILPKEKQPVPDKAAVAEAIKTIHGIYQKEYAAQDKGPLAALLLARGREAVKDPTSQFAFLSEARDVAMRAGDYQSAFEAIKELDRAYKVDGVGMKLELLQEAATHPQHQEAIVTEAMKLAAEAAEQGDDKTVERLGRMALSAARRLRNTEKIKEVVAFNKSMKAWTNFVSRAKLAVETLEERPDDPDVHSWAGKYSCLVEGDWEKGLPLVLKGTKDSFCDVAVLDAANPTETDKQVALADAWWELGETIEGVFAERLQARAAYWYKQAQPNATGITKDKIEKRLGGVTNPTADEQPIQLTDKQLRTLVLSHRWHRTIYINNVVVSNMSNTVFVFNANGSCLGKYLQGMSAFRAWNIQDGKLVMYGDDGEEGVRLSFDPEKTQFSGKNLNNQDQLFIMRPADR